VALDAADALVELADQDAVADYRRMVVRDRLAQRAETGG